jgi:hypothetical protein
MPFDRYVYPSSETPFLSAYGGRLKSVYVVLHPFLRMPDAFSRRIANLSRALAGVTPILKAPICIRRQTAPSPAP